jgi:hypothetical protein
MAQVTTHADRTIELHIHQSAAVEAMCGQRLIRIALQAMVRPVAVRIGNLSAILLDRTHERV